MINVEDQNQLFKLIAKYITKDIYCTAIGGTAMMYLGYKNITKDIDIVFNNQEDRKIFVEAITKLGYREKSLIGIYDKDKQKNKNKPQIFERGEERFDLFVKNVFGFKIKTEFVQRIDFIQEKELIIHTLTEEDLILLKAITGREKDYEDIETIIKTKEEINWDYIIDEAIKQKESNEWILIDLEETMRKLQKITFIKEKYFKKLYSKNNVIPDNK